MGRILSMLHYLKSSKIKSGLNDTHVLTYISRIDVALLLKYKQPFFHRFFIYI